jgi:AraC family transcriptional activator FtrA
MRDGLFTLSGVAGLEAAEDASTVIVPNRPDTEAPRPPELLEALRRAHARGARLVGFCSGAFTIGDAGLLDGRRAACHWMWADAFRARFPRSASNSSESAVSYIRPRRPTRKGRRTR